MARLTNCTNIEYVHNNNVVQNGNLPHSQRTIHVLVI